jgi:hypothetical protein
MDHHIPAALTAGLRARGVDIITAAEDGSQELADPNLLDRATALGRVLVSQDEDLIVEASRRMQTGQRFAGLIWGAHLSYTLRRTIDDLEMFSAVYDPEDIENQIEYLPL